MLLSLAGIAQLISENGFDQLIGELEGDHLDVKEQPYQFGTQSNHAKRELAKDISAFANAAGGYIVIGLTTAPASTHPTGQITGIKPIPRHLIDIDQYYKLINAWIHPQPAGISITLHDHGEDPTHVIGIIAIPPQDPGAKRFLIMKTVDDTKTTDITIGYAERRRDTAKHLTVVELQHALRIGLNMERELLGRLQNIEKTIEEYFQTKTTAEDTHGAYLATKLRVGTITGHETVKETPRLVLSAKPVGNTSLRSILSASPDSIRRSLAMPTSIRPGGWSLYTGDQPHLINGQYLQVDSGGAVVNLYRDGTLLSAIRIDRNNLAWADNENRDLHPLALIEFITNSTIFYKTVLNDFLKPPASILFGLDLQDLHQISTPIRLPAGGMAGRYGFWGTRHDAPKNDWHTHLTVNAAKYDPERVAFLLLRELYAWFGHTEEDMPYTTGQGDEKRVNIDAIQAIG
jgi:hypothetical protein